MLSLLLMELWYLCVHKMWNVNNNKRFLAIEIRIDNNYGDRYISFHILQFSNVTRTKHYAHCIKQIKAMYVCWQPLLSSHTCQGVFLIGL